MHNAITWFEIPTPHIARAQAFYEAVLGRSMRREVMGPQSELAVFAYEPGAGVGGALMTGTAAAQPSGQGRWCTWMHRLRWTRRWNAWWPTAARLRCRARPCHRAWAFLHTSMTWTATASACMRHSERIGKGHPMETNELHRGRLIDHVQLVVRDLAASHAFYAAVFQALKVPMGGTNEEYFWADELFVSTASSVAAQGQLTGRVHLAFQAQNRDMVHAFYEAALAHGGQDNGAPGERIYHPGYYAAFVLDPDGNNIEAVFHGDAKRSAPSVKVTF